MNIIKKLSSLKKTIIIDQVVPWKIQQIIGKITFPFKIFFLKFKKNIVFIHHENNVGDILMMSPIARELKKNKKVVFLSSGKFIEVARRIPDFDYVVNLGHFSITKLEKIFNIETLYPGYKRIFQDKKFAVKDYIELCWESLSNSPITDKGVNYKLTKKEEKFAQNFKKRTSEYLVFHGDCGPWTTRKEWIFKYWQQLIDMQTLPVVLIGCSSFKFKNCIDLRNKISINKAAAIIKHCKLFVGICSGPQWFSRAFDKPAVIINGGFESPVLSKYNKSVHIFSDVNCAPCLEKKKFCSKDKICMSRITPEIVNQEIKNKLGST